MKKPEGTYKCAACSRTWDSTELSVDYTDTPPRLTCGDGFCAGSVTKISDEPKPTRNPGV